MDLITPNSGLFIWQLSGLIYLGIWVYELFNRVKIRFSGLDKNLFG